jgi:hypothetical protein
LEGQKRKVVGVAVCSEPVSVAKFPDIREFTGNLQGILAILPEIDDF